MMPQVVLVRAASAGSYEVEDRGIRYAVGGEALAAARATVRTERYRLITVERSITRPLQPAAPATDLASLIVPS